MSDDPEKPTIIVIKRITKKGGHHGGSWKIAYADFVTAMMAFFMLMWMLSMLNKFQLQGISNYFKKPMKDIFVENQLHNTHIPKVASDHTENSELAPAKRKKDGHSLKKNTAIKANIAEEDHEKADKKTNKTAETKEIEKEIQKEQAELKKLKEKLIASMKSNPEIKQYEKHLDFELVDDGLKVVIKSLKNKPMFSVGKTDFEAYGASIIKWLSNELNKSPKKITIIGHTDTQAYGDSGHYTNWELSSDRANAMRRYLVQNGMDKDKIIRIQGSGSMNLLFKKDGDNPANRRIEVIVLTDKAASRIMKQ